MVSTKRKKKKQLRKLLSNYVYLVSHHVLAVGGQNVFDGRESGGVICGLENIVRDSVALGH